MQHLLKVLNHIEPKIKDPFGNKYQRRYLCYKINGFWFRLNYNQWAKFREINPRTIYARAGSGKTNEEILGYKKILMGFARKKHEEN